MHDGAFVKMVKRKVLDAQARFLHVAAVVHALADELLVRRYRGKQPHAVAGERVACAGATDQIRCQTREQLPVLAASTESGAIRSPNCTPHWDAPFAA